MLRRLLSRRLARQLPIFRLIAVVQIALLAREHLRGLEPADRQRLLQLVRKGRGMSHDERAELRAIAGKLDAGAFVRAAADRFSPVPLGGRSHRGA